MYDLDTLTLPQNYADQHPFDQGDFDIRDEKLAPWPRTPEIVREHLAAYYAMITHLDDQVGTVLQALEASGKAANTIVVFAGDNGLAVGQHGLLGKQNMYDHSVRVPLVFAGPGIPEGEQSEAFTYLIDIYPTLFDLADIKVPESVEGRSLVSTFGQPEAAMRETLIYAYKDFQRAARDRKMKLIEYAVEGTHTTQLFDLETDPWETNNLAASESHQDDIDRLRVQLDRWHAEFDDPTEPWWND
jgi:arylsulfatase A-like enzyme